MTTRWPRIMHAVLCCRFALATFVSAEGAWVLWSQLQPPTPGFSDPQASPGLGHVTCPYPFSSVVFERVDVAFAPGSRRIATHDSVRVEFEST